MAAENTQEVAPEPSEGTLVQKMQEKIRKETEASAQAAINERIEAEKAKIRSGGEGGFWGFLKGLIFMIAEAFGFDGWLAKQFGMPIPDQTEVTALSKQIAQSTSEVLTAKDYKTPEEMQTAVTAKVQADLMKPENRQAISSFPDERLQEAAATAGAEAAKKYNEIHQGYNQTHPKTAPAPAVSGNKATDVKQAIEAIVDSSVPIEDKAIKQKVVKIGSDVVMANQDLVTKGDMNTLAAKYTDELFKDAALKENLKKTLNENDEGKLKQDVTGLLSDVLNAKPSTANAKSNQQILSDALAGKKPAEKAAEVKPADGKSVDAKPADKPELIEEQVGVQQKIAEKKLVAALEGKKNDPGLAMLTGKEKLEETDITAIAHILAPKLVELNQNKENLKSQGDKAFTTVADQVGRVLKEHKEEFNKNRGMKLNDAKLTIIADSIAVGVTNTLLDRKDANGNIATTAPASFGQKGKADLKELLKANLADEIAGKIETQSAVKVLEIYNNKWVAPGWPKEAMVVMNRHYRKEGEEYIRNVPDNQLSNLERVELQNAHRKAYEAAVDNHSTLNDKQRTLVGKLVAEAVIDTKDPGKGQGAYADAIETAIKDKLVKNTAQIDAIDPYTGWTNKGNTVERINGEIKGDILGIVAKGVADKIRENKDGAYTQLMEAQKLFAGPTAKQVAENLKNQPSTPAKEPAPPEMGDLGGLPPPATTVQRDTAVRQK